MRVLYLDPTITYNGQNALHMAAARGKLEMVKYLIEMIGFDIDSKTSAQKTALDIAKEIKNQPIVNYLTGKINRKAPRPLPPVPAKPAAKPAPKHEVKPVTKSCVICSEDRQQNQFITLGCGHEYCIECLSFMLETTLREKNTRTFKCPTPGCPHLLENDIHKISRDHAKRTQFADIQLQEYLTREQNTKNCPTPNCGYSFINERADQFTHQCPDCKSEYCGQCLFAHNPQTTCALAQEERNLTTDRNAQERANQAWQDANTKPCPQCGTRIEKNEGCMHMRCARCEHHFCWICLNPWQGHNNYYACNYRPDLQQAHNQHQPHQQVQQEQITPQNAHMFFARDPRGFINLMRNRRDLQIAIDINFAERFTRLSCEQQGQWAAALEQQIEQHGLSWQYLGNMAHYWNTELNRLEPFAFSIATFNPTREGTNMVTIATNRSWELITPELLERIKEWIIAQSPHELIMFHNAALLACETSLSREHLQELLNAASRHFRSQIPARASQRMFEVRDNRIVALPHTSDQTYNRLANYLIIRRPDLGVTVLGNRTLWVRAWDRDLFLYVPLTDAELEALINEAYNHIA